MSNNNCEACKARQSLDLADELAADFLRAVNEKMKPHYEGETDLRNFIRIDISISSKFPRHEWNCDNPHHRSDVKLSMDKGNDNIPY